MSKRLIVASLSFGLIAWSSGSVSAENDSAPEKNPYRSITTINVLADAKRSIEESNWKRASEAYLAAAHQYPDCLDFWIWSYNAAKHAKRWEVAQASLEHIFDLQPEETNHLSAEYGETLFYTHKDEAGKYLRQALSNVDTDNLDGIEHLMVLAEKHQKAEMEKFAAAQVETKIKAKHDIEIRTKEDQDRKDKWDQYIKDISKPTKPGEEIVKTESNTLPDACRNSEGIIIAEYLDYVKAPDIQFFNPPQANFKVEKILKGPPLAKTIPVRFEFHDQLADNAPSDWTFTEEKMPKKGDKLILFLEPAVPKQNQFETYHGSFGRFPADTAHLNPLFKYLHDHGALPM